ncbi:MAG TPA: tetratricopeptide repeat protein, partial [Thermoanaerobaculia bacterium]
MFQKALELSPNDAGIQKNLVRSLIAQRNPAAAVAILKAAPRTADSLSLLAEAQLEMGERGDAGRTAEQAFALDSGHEGARLLLSRLRISEGSFDAALAAVAPLVDAALAARDFPRAASSIAPILASEAAHPGALAKMADVRDAEGNPPEAARLRLALAHEEERRGDLDAAIETYRKVLTTLPGQPDAAARLAILAPPAPGTEEPRRPAETAESELPEIEVEIDESPAPAPAAAPGGPAPHRPGARSAEEQEIETLVVEAEVFAKYGLTDKAIERLRALVRRRPDLLPARERLVDLLKETANSGLPAEANELAAVYRAAGRGEQADALLARLGLQPGGAAPAPPLPAAAPSAPPPVADIQFDEFNLEPAPPPAAEFVEDFGAETIRFTRPEAETVPDAAPAPASHRPTSAEPVAAVDSDFVSYEELGSLLQDEMQRAGDAPHGAPHPPPKSVDDNNLFADEQQFFNLAEELEKELAEDVPAPAAPAMAGPEGEASLEEIFREFKKGVEQQLSAEDYETHFNLGIAYKEMGLVDEAIGEFQLASKDPTRAVECCSMLGLCFLEKGMPQLAIKWYRKGLEAGNIRELETVGLLYDLGCVYQSTGDMDL